VPPGRAKTYHEIAMPEALLADFERWKNRLIMRWVAERYRICRVAHA
jgi:hypothetical protein